MSKSSTITITITITFTITITINITITITLLGVLERHHGHEQVLAGHPQVRVLCCDMLCSVLCYSVLTWARAGWTS
jgi:hypothetical protein